LSKGKHLFHKFIGFLLMPVNYGTALHR
jgi:hypothetical protein